MVQFIKIIYLFIISYNCLSRVKKQVQHYDKNLKNSSFGVEVKNCEKLNNRMVESNLKGGKFNKR